MYSACMNHCTTTAEVGDAHPQDSYTLLEDLLPDRCGFTRLAVRSTLLALIQ